MLGEHSNYPGRSVFPRIGDPMKLLILSDIHGNWPALEAVIQAEGSWDAVAFCGDVVDYGPHPLQCVRWVARHAEYRVRGNHDGALAGPRDQWAGGRAQPGPRAGLARPHWTMMNR